MASNTAKLLKVAANGQISIGKEWAGRQILVEKVNDGELRILSCTFVADSNATFYSKNAQETLKEFNQWSSTHPPKQTDITALFDRIEKKAAKRPHEKTKKRA